MIAIGTGCKQHNGQVILYFLTANYYMIHTDDKFKLEQIGTQE